MSEEKRLQTIEPLKGSSNYARWRVRVISYLRSRNLWYIIDPTASQRTTRSIEEDRGDDNDKALDVLINLYKDQSLDHIAMYRDAKIA